MGTISVCGFIDVFVRSYCSFIVLLHLFAHVSHSLVTIYFFTIYHVQAVKKKTTENQTRMMVREAATSTDFRKNKIMEILNKIKYNDAASVKGFGLNVAGQFAKIPARILNPPMLEYSKNKTVLPSRGAWRAENIDFIVPQKNINWGVLILDYRTQRSQVEAFCKTVGEIIHSKSFVRNY